MTARWPNGPEGFITTFKDLGAFIAIYDEIVVATEGIEDKVVDATEQLDYDFGTVRALPTFINNMVSLSNNINTGRTNLISAVTTYLTTVVQPDIDTTATTASGILADLIFVMNGATTGAAPSGIAVLLSGHFHTFFLEEYGIALPVTSGSIILTQAESMDTISGTLPSIRRQISDAYAD